MYTPITDRELKKVSEFKLGVDYYHKNGNGNWYKGQLKNLDSWHSINTSDGLKRVLGREISGVGICSDNEVFELDEDNILQLPPFPEFFIFGGKEIKTEDLSKTDINLIVERWKLKE